MAVVFAEVELASLRDRVRSGLQNAVSKGRKLGSIPAAFHQHFPLYQSGNLNITELARVCGCSRLTVYRYPRLNSQ
jgi:DNA invertase Pin-like site-specific DNA recombinase